MYNKNLILIIIAQIFGFTAAPVTIFLSGIIGSTLTSLTTLSTLPTASMVIGLASSTMIASKIMSRIGRKRGFIYDFLSSMRQKINDPLGVRKKRRELGQ